MCIIHSIICECSPWKSNSCFLDSIYKKWEVLDNVSKQDSTMITKLPINLIHIDKIIWNIIMTLKVSLFLILRKINVHSLMIILTYEVSITKHFVLLWFLQFSGCAKWQQICIHFVSKISVSIRTLIFQLSNKRGSTVSIFSIIRYNIPQHTQNILESNA